MGCVSTSTCKAVQKAFCIPKIGHLLRSMHCAASACDYHDVCMTLCTPKAVYRVLNTKVCTINVNEAEAFMQIILATGWSLKPRTRHDCVLLFTLAISDILVNEIVRQVQRNLTPLLERSTGRFDEDIAEVRTFLE